MRTLFWRRADGISRWIKKLAISFSSSPPYKSKKYRLILAGAFATFLVILVVVVTHWPTYIPPQFSSKIIFENASVLEDFELFGNRSCSAQRKLIGKTQGITDKLVSVPSLEETEFLHSDLENGGHFIPKCLHSQKVAIIIPFRNREEHLRIFLYFIHKILKRQLIEYQIFAIEQLGSSDSEPFNRATLFNVGFIEALKLQEDFNCFIFHDVDLIPDDDHSIYKCGSWPKHMATFISEFNYRLPYHHYFGGVVIINKSQFEEMNGCSNRFWAWGGEDDDMYNRILDKKWLITRYGPQLARYTMLSHKPEVRLASFNQLLDQVEEGKKYFQTSGLNDLKYELVKIDKFYLYTRVQVNLHQQFTKFQAEMT